MAYFSFESSDRYDSPTPVAPCIVGAGVERMRGWGPCGRPSVLYKSSNSARWLSGSLCKSLCSGSNSVDNMLITSTATNITGQCAADLFLAGVGIMLQQFVGGHQKTRGTKTTLKPLLLPKGLLEWMHLS